MTMVQTAALAAGLSWAPGIRRYATVLLVGVLAHSGMVDLPTGLAVVSHPWVIAFVAFAIWLVPRRVRVWRARFARSGST